MSDMMQAIVSQAGKRLPGGADQPLDPRTVDLRTALGPGRGRRAIVGLGGAVSAVLVFSFAERLCRSLADDTDEGESSEAQIGTRLARFVTDVVNASFAPDALNMSVTVLPPLVLRSTVALNALTEEGLASMAIGASGEQLTVTFVSCENGGAIAALRSGPRLLSIDDDPLAHRLLAGLLKDTDFVVIGVTDPMEALKHIEQDPPDIVLLDYEMPVMTGLMCLKRIRAHHPHLPVVMVTAHNAMKIVKQCLGQGASGFLIKPYRIADLQKQLEHVLRRQAVSTV